jgi:hypothetical protein
MCDSGRTFECYCWVIYRVQFSDFHLLCKYYERFQFPEAFFVGVRVGADLQLTSRKLTEKDQVHGNS